MKKIVALLFCILLAFTVCGCGDGSSPGDKTGNENNTTVQDGTHLSRAMKMVENYEKIPSSDKIYGSAVDAEGETAEKSLRIEKNPSVLSKGVTLSETGGVTDLTTPDAYYYNSPSWDSHIVPSQILSYDIVDSTIKKITENIKSQVLENVVQLGIWVQLNGNGNDKNTSIRNESYLNTFIRLNYDVNTDTAVLEYLESRNSEGSGETGIGYYKILSSYTSDGKVAIKASYEGYTKYDYHTITGYSTHSIEYIEGVSYKFSCFEPIYSTRGEINENGAMIILPPDIAKTIILEKNLADPADQIIIKVAQAAYPAIEYEYLNTRTYWHDGTYRYTYKDGTYYFSTLNGKPIFEFDDNIERSGFYLNLYNLDGWDRCYTTGNETFLEIKEETYSGYLGCLRIVNRKDGLVDGRTSAVIPYLRLDFGDVLRYLDTDDVSWLSYIKQDEFIALIEMTLEEYGLSFKEEALSSVYDYFKTTIAQQTAFGFENLYNADLEDVLSYASQMMIFDAHTQADLAAMFEEEHVSKDGQVADETYLSYINATLSGRVICSESGLNFSGISASVQKSALLEKDKNYRLVLLVKGDFDRYEIEVSRAEFNGADDVYLHFDDSFKLNLSSLTETQYRLFLYVKNESGMRVSEYYAVAGESDFTYSVENTEFQIVSEGGTLTIIRTEAEARD